MLDAQASFMSNGEWKAMTGQFKGQIVGKFSAQRQSEAEIADMRGTYAPVCPHHTGRAGDERIDVVCPPSRRRSVSRVRGWLWCGPQDMGSNMMDDSFMDGVQSGDIYRVISPDGVLVREGALRSSKAACKIEAGEEIEVLEKQIVDGGIERLRFSMPGVPVGWVSAKREDGNVLCEPIRARPEPVRRSVYHRLLLFQGATANAT